MTMTSGAFDATGISQGPRLALDDLADVDTAEAKEGQTIILRFGRWVPGEATASGGGGLDQAAADLRYVNISGDVMQGPLSLAAEPVLAMEVANKQYVDTRTANITPIGPAGGDLSGTYPNPQILAGAIVDADVNAAAAIQQSKVANLSTDLAGRVLKTGDSMTGTLTFKTSDGSKTLGVIQKWAFNDFLEIGSSGELWLTPNSGLNVLVMNAPNSDIIGHGNNVVFKDQWLGTSFATFSKVGLHNMHNHGVQNVLDPVNPQDAATKKYVDTSIAGITGPGGSLPVGTITMYGGNTAPTGWQLCDGSTAGSSALAALVGDNVPDLRDRFIVGAGTSYALKATGGEATHLLTAAESGQPAVTTAAEVAEHTHTTNASAFTSGTISANHTHSGTSASGGPTHTHDDSVDEGITTGDSNDWVDTADDDTTGNPLLRTNVVRPANTAIGHTHTLTTGNVSANHTHQVDVPATTSGGRSAVHTHTIAAAPAAAAHENRPPYYALTFIIKY